jgi:integrase
MLTDNDCKNAKPLEKGKPRKISDSGGLYLEITATGSKQWRVAYRFDGKQRKDNIKGGYPAVSLAEARKRRTAIKEMIAAGIDPGSKKLAKATIARPTKTLPLFSAMADEWFKLKVVGGDLGESATDSTTRRVTRLKAALGHLVSNKIESSDILDTIATLQGDDKHCEVARTVGVASRIFRFGKAKGYCKYNPASDLGDALISEAKGYKPRPALTDPVAFGALLRKIETYNRGWNGNIVGLALRLLPLVATRPFKEFCLGEWSEINFDKALWTISASRMKERDGDHCVPLSTQAIKILHWIQKRTGNRRFIFSLGDDTPITENAINVALRSLGYDTKTQQCGHGFRRSFSTMLNKEYRADGSKVWHNDVIELQLAHHEQSTRAIYNETGPESLLPQRAKMMQHWGDRCDAMRDGGEVVPIRPKRKAA